VERQQQISHDATHDAGQLAVLLDDAAARIDQLTAAIGEQAAIERRFIPVAFRARLLVAEGHRDQGIRLLSDFAAKHLPASATDADRAKLLLELGNLATTIGNYQEAEGWYRQLQAIAPNSYVLLAKSLAQQNKVHDAVEVCLQAAANRPAAEVATVLTQLLSGTGGEGALDKRVQPLIDSALAADRNNTELLMSLAVRNVTENNNDEAIKLFRQVLALRPHDALALNNLATLLAEKPNQLGEARQCVEQAIAVAGRNPALLDTLGTIQVRSGDDQEAVSTLEEAVAGTALDPRYYFHLAVAYQRSGQAAKAKEKLYTARQYGLDRAILTSGDRELLTSLNTELQSATRSN
jgi:tetratricopeptide (TPR) repeat protein